MKRRNGNMHIYQVPLIMLPEYVFHLSQASIYFSLNSRFCCAHLFFFDLICHRDLASVIICDKTQLSLCIYVTVCFHPLLFFLPLLTLPCWFCRVPPPSAVTDLHCRVFDLLGQRRRVCGFQAGRLPVGESK